MTARQYNKCVNESADALFRYGIRLCGKKEKAEDLVQHAFEVLWARRNKVKAQHASSYLFKCVYHEYLRLKKKKSLHVTYRSQYSLEPITDPSHSLIQKDQIENAFKKLNDQQKSLLLLRDIEGYDYKEIGKILNLSESQVKVYLFRARKRLKEIIMIINKVERHG